MQGDSVEIADKLAARVAAAMRAAEGTRPEWAIEIETSRIDHARITMRITPAMINGPGTMHGGMKFALANTALVYASNSRNIRAGASQASIIFLTPGRLGECLTADALLGLREGRSAVYAVSVTGEDGRAVAEFQGHTPEIGGAIIEETNHG